MKIKNILYPTDFSESASRALPHALMMARKFGSKVTLLHVELPYADDPSHPQHLFFDENRYAKYLKNQLNRTLSEIGSETPVITAVVRDASPALGILRFLDRNPVDAVVMGTHGRSALGRFLLGTVAEKVVRHARCPVLTVARHRARYRDNPSFKKCLVPFDFSDYSLELVRQGRQLSKKYGADLHVLHVLVQPLQSRFPSGPKNIQSVTASELAPGVKEALSNTLRENGCDGLTIQVEICEENVRASEGIVDYARRVLTDVIIMGNHGLTESERKLFASTTERVVRTAPCPVLTIHKP